MHNPMYGVHGDIRKSGQSVIQVDCHYSSSTPSHTTTTPPVRLIHLPPHLPFYPSPLVSLSLRLTSLSLLFCLDLDIFSPLPWSILSILPEFSDFRSISTSHLQRFPSPLLHRPLTVRVLHSDHFCLPKGPSRSCAPSTLCTLAPFSSSCSLGFLSSASLFLSSLRSSLLLNSHRRPNGYPRFDHHHCCRTPNLRLRPPFSYQLLLHHHHSLQ